MTEQEALNDPLMKTIIVLSGYVRQLGEGNDFEKTTYKTAKTIEKIFSKHNKKEIERWKTYRKKSICK